MIQDSNKIAFEFSSEDGGIAPMTWGQRSIWRPLQQLPARSSYLNLTRTLVLEQGVSLDAATRGLRRLVERHQSMRTHFVAGPPPQQIVARCGRHEITVLEEREGNIRESAVAAARELAFSAFDLENEWPLRVALIRAGGLIQGFGIAVSHVGADAFALELLVRDLASLVAGSEPELPVDWQPLDQAEYEMSEAGAKRSAKSLKHWSTQLERASAKLFNGCDRPAQPTPFRRFTLQSRAIAVGSRCIADQTRTSTSTVLLTVGALVLRALNGRPNTLLRLIAGNRYSAKQRGLTAPMCQEGAFILAAEAGDLQDAVRAAYRDATQSYSCAYYDPDDLVELFEQTRRSRCEELALTAYFNDTRLGAEWAVGALDDPTAEELGRFRSESRLSEASGPSEHDMSFYLTADSFEGGSMSLLADTRELSVEDCERVLFGIERVLCEAALRSIPLGEIDDLVSGSRLRD